MEILQSRITVGWLQTQMIRFTDINLAIASGPIGGCLASLGDKRAICLPTKATLENDTRIGTYVLTVHATLVTGFNVPEVIWGPFGGHLGAILGMCDGLSTCGDGPQRNPG